MQPAQELTLPYSDWYLLWVRMGVQVCSAALITVLLVASMLHGKVARMTTYLTTLLFFLLLAVNYMVRPIEYAVPSFALVFLVAGALSVYRIKRVREQKS